MDGDEPRARPDDALTALKRQDLDPLSIAELEARIETLESEAARTRAHIERAGAHRTAADALFRTGADAPSRP